MKVLTKKAHKMLLGKYADLLRSPRSSDPHQEDLRLIFGTGQWFPAETISVSSPALRLLSPILCRPLLLDRQHYSHCPLKKNKYLDSVKPP